MCAAYETTARGFVRAKRQALDGAVGMTSRITRVTSHYPVQVEHLCVGVAGDDGLQNKSMHRALRCL